MAISKLNSLPEQAGQLLIMGFDGTELTDTLRATLSAIQPGGVILFARNIVDPRQTWTLLRDCQKCVRTPLFCCVDMEGGTVDRLKEVIAPAPSAEEVFASGNKKAFRLHGRVIAEEVRVLGFNVDFAPVSDLALPASRAVLTSRTVSADPKETVTYVREFLRGLRDKKILGCGKHFPGLGEARLDTHHKLAAIKKPFAALWKEDLVPYRELHRDMPFVMVAHAAYPTATKEKLPASLSKKWLTDILRKKIGYKGIILSDDLEMGGVLAAAKIGDAAVATIAAGSDMYLVCHKDDNVWASFEAVLHAAERDKRFAAKIADSSKRVLATKRKFGITKRRVSAPSEKTINKLRCDLWEFAEEVRLVKAGM
jgi:beta-N-acetylhexosaminidase